MLNTGGVEDRGSGPTIQHGDETVQCIDTIPAEILRLSLLDPAEQGIRENPKAASTEHLVLLIPEFCPEVQRQRLTVNKSILLVQDNSKRASMPLECQHSASRPCIQQNSLFVAA